MEESIHRESVANAQRVLHPAPSTLAPRHPGTLAPRHPGTPAPRPPGPLAPGHPGPPAPLSAL
jgi:hypothetical protein